MKSVLAAFLFTIPICCFSQERDSISLRLKKEVALAATDSIKINALIDLSSHQIGGILAEAENTINEAFQLINSQETINKKQLGAAYVQLGVLNRRRSYHIKAAEYYLKALSIFKAQNDSLLVSDVYHNLGMLYRHEKEPRKAVDHYLKSIAIKEKINDIHGLAASYNMMGVSYRALKKIDSTLFCYTKAKELFTSINSFEDVQRVNRNFGIVYAVQKKYDKALKSYRENIANARKLDKRYSLSTAYYSMAMTYIRLKDYPKAMNAVDSAIFIAKEEGYRDWLAKSYLRKSFVYNKMGDYKNAYDFYRIFNRHSDSIFNIENVKKIQELELNYQFRQEQLADSLKFAQEKREVELLAEAETSKKQLYFLLFVLALIAASVIWILIRRIYKSRALVIAEKLEKEKAQKQILDQQIQSKEEEIKRLIADNTMRLTFKEEMLQQLKKELSTGKPEAMKQSLESLTRDLQSQIATEGKLTSLQNKIDEVNQGFDTKLRESYPDLTKTEREVCALLRLNLSIKEIMTIRNSSMDAVKSVRYRIRKKMGLSAKEELEQFIQSL